MKYYFNSEIPERKAISKKLSKYVATFNYIDKTLIVLSVTSPGISISSFTSVIGFPIGIASASFSFVFSLVTEIKKKIKKIRRNKKKKHDEIMLAKSKLNRTENLISQALTDLEIVHEEFKTIVDENQIKIIKIKDKSNKKEGKKIKIKKV